MAKLYQISSSWIGSIRVQRGAIVTLSLLISLTVYARALFTPIGISSFGRTFAWYVNYYDFGFIHRGLVGSVVAMFAPGRITNSYAIPYAIYPLFLLTAAMIGMLAARRWFADAPERTRYLAILLLSPAFVVHYSYSTGDFNVLLAIDLILSLIFIRHRFIPMGLLIVAMATHEIFFVAFAPCVCVALYLCDGRRFGRAVIYGVTAASLFFLFAHYGLITMSHDHFIAVLGRRVHLPTDNYLEMTGDFKHNFEFTRPLFNSVNKVAWIIPALVYWIIVTILFFPLRQSLVLRAIYLGAAAAALALIPFGTDLFRWISLASVSALTLGGVLRSHGCGSLFATRPRLALALTLPWIVLGPFGSACDPTVGCLRAFPMAQFVLERL